MQIKRIDHIVLTVKSIAATLDFYVDILGMEVITIAGSQPALQALRFGQQRINLHEFGYERKPNAKQALPGSQDLCFVVDCPLSEVITHLEHKGISVEFGPVTITVAVGQMESIFIRDPDAMLNFL